MEQSASLSGDRGQDDPSATPEGGGDLVSDQRCAVCQRQVPLRWHCTSEDHLDRAACARAGGAGVWLCATCEEAAHRYMRLTGASAEEALAEVLDRLARMLTQRRTYRRHRKEA